MNNPFKKKECNECKELKLKIKHLESDKNLLDTLCTGYSKELEKKNPNSDNLDYKNTVTTLAAMFMQAHMTNSAPYSRMTPEVMAADAILNAKILVKALENI